MSFALEESDIKEKQEFSSLCPSGSRCSAPKASLQVVSLLKEDVMELDAVAGETTDIPHSPTEASKASKLHLDYVWGAEGHLVCEERLAQNDTLRD